jgi:hypothetical protein
MAGTRKVCRTKPFSWKTRSVKKSPFKTLAAAKKAETAFWGKRAIGFTATSSLKAMGRIPRASGCYVLGPKYAQGKE